MAPNMEVQLVIANESQKRVVEQLLEFNSHEFSRFDKRDVGADGKFGYPYLGLYWAAEEDRHPFLIEVDGRVAGCVLVRRGSPHRIAEFFVLNKFRRQGVGLIAAHEVFRLFPGEWEIEQWTYNVDAGKFWDVAIPASPVSVETSHAIVTRRFVTSG